MDSVRALKNSPPDCFLRLRRRAVLISSSQAKSMTLRRIGEGSYLVGEDGFGPSKLNSNRFTVCPLWPLGNSPIFFFLFTAIPCGVRIAFWSWWTDSNPRPADYKSAALPTELHQRFSSQLVHNVAYYIRQREGCQQKKQKNSKNFERAEKRPERREREHEREDFYQSAAGYAAPTGGGLVPAVPE